MSLDLLNQYERELAPLFARYQHYEFLNQQRVLKAFQEHRVGEHHLHGTHGYGHDDLGRETLEKIFAQVMGAEAALVRPHIASGTHAITAALFGMLRPNDELLFITGHPYDTLEEVVGVRGENNMGSLKDWGVHYREVDVRDHADAASCPWDTWLKPETRVVMIQRSRGYSWRSSLFIEQIEALIKEVKSRRPDIYVFVDNCYGEFVEDKEPCAVGADLIAGSLIKNPGGGIVPTGGYVAGKAELIERVACRVFAPGMGSSAGATLGFNRLAYQGLFIAPHTVSQALQGTSLTAKVLQGMGFTVSPEPEELRTDIIQAIRFGSPEKLVKFCQSIQKACPIDAYVTPEPYATEGYHDQVIMAAGTFSEGSTIELSADGPLRAPYIGYLQGGLSYTHCKIAALYLLELLA